MTSRPAVRPGGGPGCRPITDEGKLATTIGHWPPAPGEEPGGISKRRSFPT